jgi:hypothetical protein
VPLYEDLVRRALRAGQRPGERRRNAERVRALARILRDADTGQVAIVRCAWCDRLKLEQEWLHLDAIGDGQQQIKTSLLERVSHGICPDCFHKHDPRLDRLTGKYPANKPVLGLRTGSKRPP